MATSMMGAIALIIAGEVLIHFVFFIFSRIIGKKDKDRISVVSVTKGFLERTFVVTSLWFQMTSALTLLGALKIATRIKDNEDKVSNDFFLVGNLVSVLFGIAYYVLLKHLIG